MKEGQELVDREKGEGLFACYERCRTRRSQTVKENSEAVQEINRTRKIKDIYKPNNDKHSSGYSRISK